MTIQETIERLKEGNKRFTADKLDGKLQDSNRRTNLTSGQNPYAIVLGCADSRVVPELAFDAGLGELFTVRVAGNIANTESIASIEYAVANLGSKVIVVLGHESCGAVTAAINGGDNGHNLNILLTQITPAVVQAASDDVNTVVKKNARLNAKELINRSEIIRTAVEQNKLKIVSAYYHLKSGQIDFMEDE